MKYPFIIPLIGKVGIDRWADKKLEVMTGFDSSVELKSCRSIQISLVFGKVANSK